MRLESLCSFFQTPVHTEICSVGFSALKLRGTDSILSAAPKFERFEAIRYVCNFLRDKHNEAPLLVFLFLTLEGILKTRSEPKAIAITHFSYELCRIAFIRLFGLLVHGTNAVYGIEEHLYAQINIVLKANKTYISVVFSRIMAGNYSAAVILCDDRR